MNDTRIAELRKARGWTQERLAQESGIAVRTIQRMEAGNDASLETVSLVAAALQVPVGDLFATIADTDYEVALEGLEKRTTQQSRRDAITREWRRACSIVGLVVTLGVLLLIGRGLLSGLAIFIIPIYWVSARFLRGMLFTLVIDPWLDRKYPLTHSSTTLAL